MSCESSQLNSAWHKQGFGLRQTTSLQLRDADCIIGARGADDDRREDAIAAGFVEFYSTFLAGKSIAETRGQTRCKTRAG